MQHTPYCPPKIHPAVRFWPGEYFSSCPPRVSLDGTRALIALHRSLTRPGQRLAFMEGLLRLAIKSMHYSRHEAAAYG